jgi:hypothetical protein
MMKENRSFVRSESKTSPQSIFHPDWMYDILSNLRQMSCLMRLFFSIRMLKLHGNCRGKITINKNIGYQMF